VSAIAPAIVCAAVVVGRDREFLCEFAGLLSAAQPRCSSDSRSHNRWQNRASLPS